GGGGGAGWLRGPLARLAADAGAPFDPCPLGPALARAALNAAPLAVLGLTGVVAVLGFAGDVPSGPGPGTFFAYIGAFLSYVVPLALLAAGLAGTGVRERSAGYAFAAGGVVNAAVSLCVWQLHRAQPLAEWGVALGLGNALASAGVALAWLGLRAWGRNRTEPGALLRVQSLLGLGAVVVLALAALA